MCVGGGGSTCDISLSPLVLHIERQQAADSDIAHTRDLVLQSVLSFDPSGLHHVATEVKNHLPSIGSESDLVVLL